MICWLLETICFSNAVGDEKYPQGKKHPTGFLEKRVCWAIFHDMSIERAPVQKLEIQDDMLATRKNMFF